MVGNLPSVSASSTMGMKSDYYNVRENIRDRANTETVQEALLPILQGDSDGIVYARKGWTVWDVAQAAILNGAEDDAKTISAQIAEDSDLDDANEIKVGQRLDVSRYFGDDATDDDEDDDAGSSTRRHRSSNKHSGTDRPGSGDYESGYVPPKQWYLPGNCFPMPTSWQLPMGNPSSNGNGQTTGQSGNAFGNYQILSMQNAYYNPETNIFMSTTTTFIRPVDNGSNG